MINELITQQIDTIIEELTALIKQREDSRPKAQEKAWIRDVILKQKLPSGQKVVIHFKVNYRYQRTRMEVSVNKTDSFADEHILIALNRTNTLKLEYDFVSRYDMPSLAAIYSKINKHLS